MIPFQLFIFFTLSILLTSIPHKTFGANLTVCPDLNTCTCSKPDTISCIGENINKANIETYLNHLRSNNSEEGIMEYLIIKKFELSSTQMTDFDLWNLRLLLAVEVVIKNNSKLSTFTSSGSNDAEKLKVENLIITESAWNGAQLAANGAIWAAISASFIKTIIMPDNEIDTIYTGAFTALTTLESLDLSNNLIDNFENGFFPKSIKTIWLQNNNLMLIQNTPFHNMEKVELIDLSNNKIGELGNSDLELAHSVDSLEKSLTINLTGNLLTDPKIIGGGGLGSTTRPTTVDLSDNSLIYISFENFGPFIFSNLYNKLILDKNPLICNERLQWISDARVILEKRIIGTSCLNDDNSTIFETGRVENHNGGVRVGWDSGMVVFVLLVMQMVLMML